MEKQVIKIEAQREGYALNQITSTMTVGELINYLSQFDEDTKVYLSHDGGYTYGGIREKDIEDDWYDEDADE